MSLNQWAKTAQASDVERANLILKKEQSEEEVVMASWYNERETILLPYFNGNQFLARVVLEITMAMKDWLGSLGWSFKDGVFLGIRKGTKVVCTKSNLGHVGYVEDLQGPNIWFRIVTMNESYAGSYEIVQADWGLTVLPDNADISKQMTASEALKYLQIEKKDVDEKKVEEANLSLPEVLNLSWGVIKVKHSGDTLTFKDAKLYPGHATAWDWGETGTHHNPGIQYADVREILNAGVDRIILTRGQYGNLGITNGLVDQIEQEDVAVDVAQTEEAVTMYERYRKQGVNVGIIIHSTC